VVTDILDCVTSSHSSPIVSRSSSGISGDADSVPEDGCLDVIPGIRVYAAHQADKFARLRLVVAAKLVYRFSDQVNWHLLTLACFRYGKDSICQPAIGAEI